MSEALKNLGPVSREWLSAVGINARADLEKLGAVAAFRLVRLQGFNASLNLLYALEAALRDIHWTDLPPAVKAQLKAAARAIKQQQ